MSCPKSVLYTGSPLEPCTAMVRGAGGLDLSLTVTYFDNTEIGQALAQGWYQGDSNHEESILFLNFDITSGASNDDTQTVSSEVEVPESDLPAPLTNEKDTSGEGSDTKGADTADSGDSQSSSSGDDQGDAALKQDAAAKPQKKKPGKNEMPGSGKESAMSPNGLVPSSQVSLLHDQEAKREKDEAEGNQEA